MDDFQKKREILTKIRDESGEWLETARLEQKIISFYDEHIAYLTEQVTSEKFVKDHEDYLVALGKLDAYRTSKNAITTAQARYDKAIAELKQLAEDEKYAA